MFKKGNKNIKRESFQLNNKIDFFYDFFHEYEEIFFMINSSLFDRTTDNSECINEIIEILNSFEIKYDIIKIDSDKKSFFGFKSSEKIKNYRLGFFLKNHLFKELLEKFINKNVNFRFACGINIENKKQLKDFFISNILDDDNRFDYYSLDCFFHSELNSLTLAYHKENLLEKEKLEEIKERLL